MFYCLQSDSWGNEIFAYYCGKTCLWINMMIKKKGDVYAVKT